jgi:hypothetical protein
LPAGIVDGYDTTARSEMPKMGVVIIILHPRELWYDHQSISTFHKLSISFTALGYGCQGVFS